MGRPHERSLQTSVMGAGGPSPQDVRDEAMSRQGPVPELVLLTLNINSWLPFRDRWSAEGSPPEIQSATVLFLQEHKLTSTALCDDAVDWCGKRGWNAVFRPAATLQSGKASGGVAILVAHRADIGVTDPMLKAEGWEHRLLALRLAGPGLEPMILVSAYLQAGGGLNRTNRTLLATMAQWQEEARAPILVGGDFNLRPDQVRSTDFLARGGLTLMVPSSATYRTSSARLL